jgi:hypothetical protein
MTYREPARAEARQLESSSSSALGAPAARHLGPPRRLLAAIALVALIGAGCSNALAETGSGGGGGGGENAAGDQNAVGYQNAAAEVPPNPERTEKRFELSRCMRENGVEEFPDPDDNGVILYYGEDPEFESAQEKCRHISPPPEGHEGNGG